MTATVNDLLDGVASIESIKENILNAIDIVREVEGLPLGVVVDEINSRVANRQLLRDIEALWGVLDPQMSLVEVILHLTQAQTFGEFVEFDNSTLKQCVEETLDVYNQ
jgi:hypothetical protein